MSLRAVLVRPHNHGNLGSAARAAKAFGASLALLDPRADRAHEDAVAYASGAEDLLASAPDLTGWDDIVSGADDVLATSSLRGRRGQGLPPAWSWARARRAAAERRVTLVFGPERSGLTNEELRLATGLVSIRTRPELPTLNLAQSVAVALALASPAGAPTVAGAGRPSSPGDGMARAAELRRLVSAWEQLLSRAGYAGAGKPEGVVAELSALLLRARPSSREVSLLLGALARVARAVDPSR